MAKFIEISGTAGVGKSTLYRELVALYKPEFNWIPAHNLFPKCEIEENGLRYHYWKLKTLLFGRDYAIDKYKLLEAGENFVEQNPLLMNVFWENIYYKQKASLNGRDQRLDKATFLFELIQKLQVVLEQGADKLAILDEGPAKLIDVLSNTAISTQNDTDEINTALSLLPQPSALIYLQTDIKENVSRLLKRKHVIPAHKNLTEKQLENFVKESHNRKALVNNYLEKKGVRILHLDANDNVRANAIKVLKFVDDIFLEICQGQSISNLAKCLAR
jgi:gluconate kinase